jgi:hypothetical protein
MGGLPGHGIAMLQFSRGFSGNGFLPVGLLALLVYLNRSGQIKDLCHRGLDVGMDQNSRHGGSLPSFAWIALDFYPFFRPRPHLIANFIIF